MSRSGEITGSTGLGIRAKILPRTESYKGRHDRGGVAQSLDGGVGPLLEVMVVAGHVEGREGRPAALHGSSQSGGRQRHAQPAVGGQGALGKLRNGKLGD